MYYLKETIKTISRIEHYGFIEISRFMYYEFKKNPEYKEVINLEPKSHGQYRNIPKILR